MHAFVVSSSFISLPLYALTSVIMHHHLQEDTSPCTTTDYSVQTIHIHYSPEQHRICPGRLHGWGLWPAYRYQLPARPVQLHREHRQHEGPYSSHRGSQRSGARPRQPARHQQHHHHHYHCHHLCCCARLCWKQGAEGSAPQVPLYRDPGLWMSLGFIKVYNKTLACTVTVFPPPLRWTQRKESRQRSSPNFSR